MATPWLQHLRQLLEKLQSKQGPRDGPWIPLGWHWLTSHPTRRKSPWRRWGTSSWGVKPTHEDQPKNWGNAVGPWKWCTPKNCWCPCELLHGLVSFLGWGGYTHWTTTNHWVILHLLLPLCTNKYQDGYRRVVPREKPERKMLIDKLTTIKIKIKMKIKMIRLIIVKINRYRCDED